MQHKWMERIRPRKPPGAFSPLLALVALRRLSNSMFTVADQDHVQDPFDLAEVRPTGEGAAPPPDSMPDSPTLCHMAARALAFLACMCCRRKNLACKKTYTYI